MTGGSRAAQRPRDRATAQVQFNDDLLKLNREVFQLYQAGAYRVYGSPAELLSSIYQLGLRAGA